MNSCFFFLNFLLGRKKIMERVRYIIDIDGFQVTEPDSNRIIIGSKKKNKKFLWKEMGVTDVIEKKTTLYTFQLSKNFSELSKEDRKNATYLRNHKTGLYFRNYQNDLPWSRIFGILKELSRECTLTDQTIAFKGGSMEKQLLEFIGFHMYLDLNEYNCPKFDELVLSPHLRRIVDTCELLPCEKYRCNRHHPLRDSVLTPHCPGLETAYFTAWLLAYYYDE